LAGRLPHEGGTAESVLYRVLNDPVRPPSELRPELPSALERITLKLLAREPEARYADAGAVKDALTEAAQRPSPSAAENWRRALGRSWRSLRGAARRVGRTRVGLGALGALALMAVGVWLAALQGWLPGASRAPRVLAVLPMRNASSDPEGTAHFGEA